MRLMDASHITMNIGVVDGYIGLKNASVFELRLKTTSAISINNGQLLATLSQGLWARIPAYYPVYDYSTGKPLNGSIYASMDGKLTYYGDNIVSKTILIHATYAIL